MSFSGRMQQNHFYTVFFAPRGRDRIYDLGMQIAQLYLSPFDTLIGIVGEAGSGKSMLIKGMFPGLELTNDDNGLNVRPLPLLDQSDEGFFTAHTYHVDIRFEAAFTQMHVLAEAILNAIKNKKRVIVEHFELIYPFLKLNAHLLIGIGEEIIITRPNLFGPLPSEIHRIVETSLKYRRMAHTAEDLCELYMPPEEYERCHHGDIKHGFLLTFDKTPPAFDLDEMEKKVLQAIKDDLTVSYVDEEHVMIGDHIHHCTGPRTHVSSTGCIEDFQLIKKVFYDALADKYMVAGVVGPYHKGRSASGINDISLE